MLILSFESKVVFTPKCTGNAPAFAFFLRIFEHAHGCFSLVFYYF